MAFVAPSMSIRFDAYEIIGLRDPAVSQRRVFDRV
jgi:hypothetical protein